MRKRKCPECLETFDVQRSDQSYCSPKCLKTYYNRRLKRGLRIIDLALQWRDRNKARNSKDDNDLAHSWLCQELGIMLDEDKEAGRQSYIKNIWETR